MSQLRAPAMRALLVAIAMCGLTLAAPASADTFKPTRFDDPAPPNKCKAGDCSLREAIKAANNHNGRDQVVLKPGTYDLEIPATDGGANEDGQLFVLDDTTIRGQGPQQTKIDANGIDRVMAVAGKTTLEGVTIKGGDAGANPFHTSLGGGILALGEKVTLRNVVVRKNEAQFGGGVRMAGQSLIVKNSTIAGNNGQEGGGLDIRAQLVQAFVAVRSSTISGNFAANGAGVMADGTASPSQVAPILDVGNSTIAGNMASASAGGIAGGQNSIVVLDNTTVAYNQADSDNTSGGAGGGIHQQGGASFQLNDSVLAINSVGSSGSGPACHGEFEDGGSLVDTTGSNPNCNFVGLVQPTVTTTPMIGPLAQNGGPTRTVRLLSGSPALGIALDCPNLDQRGRDRPDDGCDAGAFEREGP